MNADNGATPGCLGAFMNVSLYVHGMISFGAIVGGTIATSPFLHQVPSPYTFSLVSVDAQR